MNEERMDAVLDEVWDSEGLNAEDWDADEPAEIQNGEAEIEEGEAGADNGLQTEQNPAAPIENPVVPTPEASAQERVGRIPPVWERPVLQKARENAVKRDIARFTAAYPGVKGAEIPPSVWDQVSRGVPLVSAYAMHENTQLKAQLAAERQHRANQRRTPGALSSHAGAELDELDRLWAEED